MKTKTCKMCSKDFTGNNIPTEISLQMPFTKGEARMEFGLVFSKKMNVCDKCLEPIMESGLRAIRGRTCPSLIELSLHADLLKLGLNPRKENKRAKKDT